MNIVGVLGSARHGRNTATLVQKVLEGAQSAGAETELLNIHDHQVAGCNGCDWCKATNECAVDDGMRAFYKALEGSQGLVLGTPIYMDHITAQTKAFIDRLYCYLGPNLEHYFPKNYRAVLVVTYGDSNPDLYAGVIDWLKGRLAFYWDIQTIGVVVAPDADANPPAGSPPLLHSAFEAGVRLARS